MGVLERSGIFGSSKLPSKLIRTELTQPAKQAILLDRETTAKRFQIWVQFDADSN
jgi:hypothetical protein